MLAIFGNQSFVKAVQTHSLAEPNTQIQSNYVLLKVVFALLLGQDNGPFISFDIISLNYISYTLLRRPRTKTREEKNAPEENPRADQPTTKSRSAASKRRLRKVQPVVRPLPLIKANCLTFICYLFYLKNRKSKMFLPLFSMKFLVYSIQKVGHQRNLA